MNPNVSRSPLCQLLERHARDRTGERAICALPEGRSLTFGEVWSRVLGWAEALRRAGVSEGELVGIALGNEPALVELFFALRARGAGAVLLEAGAASLAPTMGAGWILHRGEQGVLLDPAPDPGIRLSPVRPETAAPGGTALVKLTSGSTLSARGACFSEAALVAGLGHILEGMDIGAADRVLVAIPLTHGYGFDNGVLSLAAGGTPLVLQSDVLPAALLRTLREHAVTVFPAVPVLVRALGQVAWPDALALRLVISASAPLAWESAEAFRQASGRPVSQFFGSTETGGISFERRPLDPGARGAVGHPLPGVRIELSGEGLVRVHSEANRFAVLPGPPVPPYVETGDRASWSPEGRLRLEGRSALLANVGGLKVDLGALDEFFRALPGVADAAVVPVEDQARGQRVVACVETGAYTAERLLEICREQLSAPEIPSEIRLVERLPRTPRGKLDRRALGEYVSRGG